VRAALSLILFLVLAGLAGLAGPAAAQPQSPEQFLGRAVGQDRDLFGWDEILSYLDHLDQNSDRIELIELGESTQGRRFVMAVVADEQGLRDKDQIRAQVRELYRVDETDEARARELAASGRAILAFSLGVHSTEVGASQVSMEILHRMVTAEDPVTVRAREKLITLLVPCMNPDGLDMVQQWYMQTVGTDAEGTRPLDLYHPYAGHDNNRDGFFNNLVETQMWSRVLYHDWLPQMVIDEHQMGQSGPRLFLPPFDDPVSPTVHPLVYTQISAAGQQAVSDLTALGWTGIATSTIFTAEWPGSVRSTGFWHNMLGVLSEVASARLATPLYFPEGSLQARGRGMDEYARSANFLAPWPGGWWRLRDIMDLERDLTWSFLRWAAEHSEDLLLNFYRMNRDAVATGRGEAPYAFVVPADQLDSGSPARMAEILRAGGVTVQVAANDLQFGDHRAGPGSLVVRCDQPFRPFIVEMLGRTDYPRLEQNGETVRPYDVTAWRLSELLGVRVLEVDDAVALQQFELSTPDLEAVSGQRVRTDRARIPATDLASHAMANAALAEGYRVRRISNGDFVIDATANEISQLATHHSAQARDIDVVGPAAEIAAPRIAIFSPWGGSMDEGWTRLVLERHGFEFEQIRPGQPDLESKADGRELAERFDVLLLPSIRAGILKDGRSGTGNGKARLGEATWPEEYRSGLGGQAGEALRAFAEAGGRIIAVSASTPWLIDAMGLPAIADGGPDGDSYAPGTLLRVTLDAQSRLSMGMGEEASAYFANGYSYRPRAWPLPTQVAASYAQSDLLVAGFLDGAEALVGRPAILQIPVGEGEVVLFGFHPQRRAQTEGTFKLLLNAIWPDPR